MSVEAIVIGIVQRDFMRIAEMVEADLKGAVAPHSRSGLALGAIHTEPRGVDVIFVGGTDGTGTGKTGTDHLAMLDEGNGSRIIKPVEARALRFTDGSLHGSARPYKGIHFVSRVASKYR